MDEDWTLELRKGGIVSYNEWVYDEDLGEGHYEISDITDKWLHNRNKVCRLASDVTLNDIFLFVSREPEIFDIALANCFVKEYVDVWKNVDRTAIKTDHSYDPDEIEYLELYWCPDIGFYADDRTQNNIEGLDRADFHGIGFVLQEDKMDGSHVTYAQGTRINWGIDFCKLEEILDLPIKLNTTFTIHDDWQLYKDNMQSIPKLVDCQKQFSLHQIIEGVMWELSFYGTEQNKITQAAKLKEISSELDEDLKNYTVDELIAAGKLSDLSCLTEKD